ncbi:MAG: hypothetical protein DMF04_07655 [Verrucomicrobia bacterium]|nr:MAG: hypothetical protein DMF04_07655 [Verrucomicrobiota bacterium]
MLESLSGRTDFAGELRCNSFLIGGIASEGSEVKCTEKTSSLIVFVPNTTRNFEPMPHLFLPFA